MRGALYPPYFSYFAEAMIFADEFFNSARAAGLDFFTGVPCSLAGPLIDRAEARADTTYLGAVN